MILKIKAKELEIELHSDSASVGQAVQELLPAAAIAPALPAAPALAHVHVDNGKDYHSRVLQPPPEPAPAAPPETPTARPEAPPPSGRKRRLRADAMTLECRQQPGQTLSVPEAARMVGKSPAFVRRVISKRTPGEWLNFGTYDLRRPA